MIDYIGNFVANKNKIDYLPNFVDLQNVPCNLIKTKRENFTFIYAGAHGLANSLDIVLEAAKILQNKSINVIIRLIGDGPCKAKLILKAKKYGLKNVVFDKVISKQNIYSVLAETDAYLMILKKAEVFKYGVSPNKLFDYLAMGKPIIASQHSTYDIVPRADCGLTFEPNNPEDLAIKITELVSMPSEKLREFGANARRYVEQYHTLSSIVDKLNDHILNVVKTA
jgi:glycosyltransferase involved in cell wall biosynthesis